MKKEKQKSQDSKEIKDEMLNNVSGGASAAPGGLTNRLDWALKRLFRTGSIVEKKEETPNPTTTTVPSASETEQARVESMPRPGTGNPNDDDPGVPNGL